MSKCAAAGESQKEKKKPSFSYQSIADVYLFSIDKFVLVSAVVQHNRSSVYR